MLVKSKSGFSAVGVKERGDFPCCPIAEILPNDGEAGVPVAKEIFAAAKILFCGVLVVGCWDCGGAVLTSSLLLNLKLLNYTFLHCLWLVL